MPDWSAHSTKLWDRGCFNQAAPMSWGLIPTTPPTAESVILFYCAYGFIGLVTEKNYCGIITLAGASPNPIWREISETATMVTVRKIIEIFSVFKEEFDLFYLASCETVCFSGILHTESKLGFQILKFTETSHISSSILAWRNECVSTANSACSWKSCRWFLPWVYIRVFLLRISTTET